MKKLLAVLVPVLFVSFIVYGQTKEIYTNSNFRQLTKDHKVVAFLPFKAIIKLRPKQLQSLAPGELEKLQTDEGIAAQSAMESYFLNRKGDLNLRISFQPLMTTNALLGRNNIDPQNIDKFTPQELCALLGVDAVMNGILSTEKPMSDGAAVALAIVVGFGGATNSGKCTINTYDGKTGELLWKYEKTLSRSLGSSTNQVINTIMRKAARKFPYSL